MNSGRPQALAAHINDYHPVSAHSNTRTYVHKFFLKYLPNAIEINLLGLCLQLRLFEVMSPSQAGSSHSTS